MKVKFSGEIEIDPADLGGLFPVKPILPIIPDQEIKPNPLPEPLPEKPTNPLPELPTGEYIRLEDYNDWNTATQQAGKILRLEPGKEYAVEGYLGTEPKLKAILGNRSSLVFGQGPQNIFTINSDKLDFGTIGVNLLQRSDAKIKPATNTKILYRTNHLTVKTGRLAMIGSQAPDDQRLTVQLAWAFSGTNGGNEGYLHIIGKDLRCNGPDFMNLKANGGGGLYSTLINVQLHNPDSFNPNEILVDGIINGDRFIITSDHQVSDILTHYGYQNGNVRSILHIGRFVFNINDRAIISQKEIKLFADTDSSYQAINRTTFGCRLDLQPGDMTNIGKIISKQLDPTYGWQYKTDAEVIANIGTIKLIQSSFNLKGPVKAFLIYKGNALIQSYGNGLFLCENNKFGDWQILIGAKYGHTSYNHSYVGGYWENFTHSGMYRQSDPKPIPIGSPFVLTLKNAKGLDGYTDRWGNFIRSQFAPPKLVNDPLHPDSQSFIDQLEAMHRKAYA